MATSRIVSLLRTPSLRQRFLVAPLLGLVLLGLLIAAFSYALRSQNALLTRIVEEDLVAFENYADLSDDLSEQHVGLFDLLNSAPQSGEETLYDNAKGRLLAIHEVTRRLRNAVPAAHSGDAKTLAQHGEALALIEAYHRAAVSAVEMTTLNVALAPREITLANQRFAAMSRAFDNLRDAELDGIRRHVGDRIERNRATTVFVALGGIFLALLLLVLSVALSRVLSRSLETQIRVLAELAGPAPAGAKAQGGDEVERMGSAIAAFRRTQLDLRESEERFRAYTESAPDAIVIVEEEGDIILVNSQTEALFGYSRTELVGRKLEMLLPQSRRAGHTGHRSQYFADPKPRQMGAGLELFGLRKDGSEFPLEISLSALQDKGRVVVCSTIRDITGRKAADAKIRRLNRIHAVLSGINSLIVRVKDRNELFDESCRIGVEVGGFRMAWIGLVDRNAMNVVPIASAGAQPENLRFIKEHLSLKAGAPMGNSLVARALQEKKVLFSNDTQNDPAIKFKREHFERGTRSLAILPLLVSGEAVGVLALYSEKAGTFDEDELKLLRELAGDISFALEHIGKSEKLEYLGYYDSLTGLANRALFQERLDQSIRSAGRQNSRLAVLLFDIERFRTINETLGRAAGDELLKQVAARAARFAGDPDRLARFGADHFAALVPEMPDSAALLRQVERGSQEIFGVPFELGDTELRVSSRLGIALFPADGGNAESLLRNAEAALKKAKSGGEKYLFYTRQMNERVAENLTLENKLRQGLEKDEFVLHYQPKVSLRTGAIVGVEALIRWQSPELGLVPPVKFIPLLEETGLILEVGAWALKRAAADHRRWSEAGLKPPRVAVNVSPIQLRQRDFVRGVERAIMEGVAPVCIDLEITESLIMQDVEATIEKLKEVRALGLKIAIDDFGTGYSSLAYLAKLPVETLKIDRTFISSMLEDPNTETLVQTIISMAHSMRLKVVAEGVETEEQARMLRLFHCDEMQGYLFSKPVPAAGIAAMLGEAAVRAETVDA